MPKMRLQVSRTAFMALNKRAGDDVKCNSDDISAAKFLVEIAVSTAVGQTANRRVE